MKSNLVTVVALGLTTMSPQSYGSFAKELLACQWSTDEYVLLRASVPRSGTGYYFIESVTAAGKQEIARFEDNRMQLLHAAVGGSIYRHLSSTYFLNDGSRQFSAHYFSNLGKATPSGLWLLNLPGYQTNGFAATSCMECEMENSYCRDLF